MTRAAASRVPWLLGAAVVAVVGAAIAFAVHSAGHVPDGPVELVWDKTACATCAMHVGEPAFAAQLTTEDGRTVAFDDPGCLFVYLERERPVVHAIWFRHHQEPRWLSRAAAAFVCVTPTPMGFGLGAVDPGTSDAVDFAAAQRLCIDRESGAAGR